MAKVTRMHHSSVLVDDLARSRFFYEELLGLIVCPHRPQLKYDGIWYDLGEQQIHLLVLPSPETGLERPEHGGRDRHVALLVDDLDGMAARLTENGVSFTRSHSGRKALFCRDPDGNAIELIDQSIAV
ncbi:glyoxalase [Candidatus Methylospira mobilis]|uniref:Glyoxalase n=1 Tax=Candidatus Methylospira mobilis TaxID=1808979 RepID=A0A5Q0BKI5_9GAMM|nr:VOC family protein [Candidatus Methylospira mobilis]QFY44089.1 glyoxalase [Candidatus Methylospira mobilis]WNV06509.1 VOC family protein [Candidatus Methylospira mobilis]